MSWNLIFKIISHLQVSWVVFCSFSQMASERMKGLMASGKVTLHHCDVAAMPLADSTVDKVFHCNCYYFWPDLRRGAAEIHRVMKPGWYWMLETLRPVCLAFVWLIKTYPVRKTCISLTQYVKMALFLQEAWWWPHWDCCMCLSCQRWKWCQGRTGALKPTWQHWKTLVLSMLE